MGVFNNFPYANFHELNADWILEQVRKVMDEWEEYRTDMDLWKLGVDKQLATFQAWFDNLDVQDEVRTVIRELIQSGEFIEITSPQIVSATEAWLAAHITPTTPAVDDTLSISGAAADAKVTGDRITDLKEDISVVYGYFDEIKHPSDYDANSYIDTGHSPGYTVNTTPSSLSGWACLVLPCKKGDKFVISGSGSTSGQRLWCFTDEDKKIISNYAYNDTVTDLELTASADGYLILNTDMSVPYQAIIKGTIDEDLAKKISYNSIKNEFVNGEDVAISFPDTGSISNVNGQLQPYETNYKSTDYIDISNVAGIYRTGTTTMYTLWRYAFYDNNKAFIGSVEDTTNYMIVTYKGMQVTWLDLSQYPTAKYIRITINPSRPYTYYEAHGEKISYYDISPILIDGVKPLKFYKKNIVNFGDSLFGNFRDTNGTTDKSISKMIADATGATVYNAGFGGCRMSYHSQYWRAFSMYALADAITTGVWTDQDAAIAAQPSGMPAYFSDTLTMLKGIDFDEIDYITIGYGTNDYTGNIFIDYRSGLEEYQYFKGALEYSLRKILTTYPHIRIVVITPCWRWFLSDGAYAYSSDDAQSVNSRGYYLYNYVDAIKEVCTQYHVPYIDTYYTLGFNEYTHLQYFPANDGTHMNESGRQLRADRIIGKMESLY